MGENFNCPCGYTSKENIVTHFYESDESQEICNSCSNLIYKNGVMSCKLVNK